MSRYRVPKQRTRIEIRVSNSRFIATVTRASSMKEAQEFLREIRAEMPDASHHVYAFKIGYGASVSERMSDDGEPSGTSGPPALAVLRGADVGDVALIITRYFGGTKLGTGGLVTAYTSAAKIAFEALETEEKIIRIRMELAIPYPLFEPVKRVLAHHECLIEAEAFEATVRLIFEVPEENVALLTQAIRDLSAGNITPNTL